MKILILALLILLLNQSISITQYKVVKKQEKTSSILLSLSYTGNESYYIKEKSVIKKALEFQFKVLGYEDFEFLIYDATANRFKILQGGIFPTDPKGKSSFPLKLSNMKFSYSANPFTFQILRATSSDILFDSSKVDIIFSEYYIQIGTITSSRQIYGFSERFTPHFRLQPGKWTIFPRDLGQNIDKGQGKQTHGYYPVYFTRQKKKNFHASYFRSTNAMDIIVEQSENNNYLLTYKTIGGIINFRFFMKNNQIQLLINQFHSYLGTSAIPPFWALGFHQSRWGYKNASVLQTVLTNYKQNDIPIDTIWSDIDYMQQNQTFTIDTDKFSLEVMKNITTDYHWVPIIQPSIRNGSGYAYDEGIKRNVFINDASNSYQIGRVWAGDVLFTDYFNPNASLYWSNMLQHLYDKVPFSGVWIDMNEISNLCNGPCYKPNVTSIIDFTNDIPYQPGHDAIQTQTIPLNATHYNNYSENNVHIYFGLMQAVSTYNFLQKKNRPFIITRSSTLGSNKYAFHWTGDNFSNYTFLRLSIAGNFMFNFWNIKMVGADICGFGGNVTSQLCARWFQLGSLYPFARNHNQFYAHSQQAFALGDTVIKASQKNLKFRYSLLKFYYSQFILNNGKNLIFKPLFFQFPSDDKCYQDEISETQFLIGSSLMSAPILQQKASLREVYFPLDSNWYNLHTGFRYKGGSTFNIMNELTDLVPLFIRQKYAIMIQNVDNVTKSRQLDNKFTILAAMPLIATNSTVRTYRAQTSIITLNDYNNETNIKSCIKTKCNYHIVIKLDQDLEFNKKIITLSIFQTGSPSQSIILNRIKIYTADFFIDFTLEEELVVNQSVVIDITVPDQQVTIL